MKGFWDIFSLLCVIAAGFLVIWCIAHLIYNDPPPKYEFKCVEGHRYIMSNNTLVPVFNHETSLPQRCQP